MTRFHLAVFGLALLLLSACKSSSSDTPPPPPPAPPQPGQVTTYTWPTANQQPEGMARGADGRLWFTLQAGGKIGRISPTGTFDASRDLLPLPAGNEQLRPTGIAAGPDGNIWFTLQGDAALQAGGKIGRISPTATSIQASDLFSLPAADDGGQPTGITAGPDGNVWFTLQAGGKIGRISPSGSFMASIPIGEAGDRPMGIAVGPDGNLWCTLQAGGKIGRISPGGAAMTLSLPLGLEASAPRGITGGSDGNLWFTLQAGGKIGRISPTATSIQASDLFDLPAADRQGEPREITSGPDGSLWCTLQAGGKIGRISPTGGLLVGAEASLAAAPLITTYPLPNAGAQPAGIALGPDGNLWFAQKADNSVARMISLTPPSTVSLQVLPATVKLRAGGRQLFTASVLGSSNTGVTWSVVEPGGGTVDATGLYTAPATPGTYHVQATSAADPTKYNRALVLVDAPVSVAISPTTASLHTGATFQFTATVSHAADSSVLWSVQETDGGSVSSSGLYTAPSAAGVFHVIARSAEDPSKSAGATVTVTLGPPVITFTANPASIYDGETSTLTWSVTRAQTVSLDHGIGSVPLSGSHTVSPTVTTDYVLTATGPGGTQTATARVTLKPGLRVTLTPGILSATRPTSGSTSKLVSVLVEPTGGFAGSLSLSLEGAPAGLTGSFSPSSLTVGPASAGSTLTLILTPTVPLGTHSMTVRAQGSGMNFPVPLQVTITAPVGSFNLTLNQPSATLLIPGIGGTNSTNLVVTVTSLDGFSGSVTLSHLLSATGLGGTFSPNPVTVPPGGSVQSTLILEASDTDSGIVGDIFPVQILGTSGGMTDGVSFDLYVPDFLVSLSPASLTWNYPSVDNVTVSVQRRGGFNGAISLVTQDPDSVLAMPPTGNIAAGANSVVLVFQYNMSATPGMHATKVIGSSGGLMHVRSAGLPVTKP